MLINLHLNLPNSDFRQPRDFCLEFQSRAGETYAYALIEVNANQACWEDRAVWVVEYSEFRVGQIDPRPDIKRNAAYGWIEGEKLQIDAKLRWSAPISKLNEQG